MVSGHPGAFGRMHRTLMFQTSAPGPAPVPRSRYCPETCERQELFCFFRGIAEVDQLDGVRVHCPLLKSHVGQHGMHCPVRSGPCHTKIGLKLRGRTSGRTDRIAMIRVIPGVVAGQSFVSRWVTDMGLLVIGRCDRRHCPRPGCTGAGCAQSLKARRRVSCRSRARRCIGRLVSGQYGAVA